MVTRILLAVCLVSLVGCGKGLNLNAVTGKVTLDGTPISGASVTFQPADGGSGKPAVATTDGEGKYQIADMRPDAGQGAAEGEYLVGVLWYTPSDPSSAKATGASSGVEEQKKDDKASRSTTSGPKAALPVHYQNPKTSGLTFSVKKGANTYDIVLDSKAKGK